MTGNEYMQTKAYELELVITELTKYALINLTEEQSDVIYDITVKLDAFRKDLATVKSK